MLGYGYCRYSSHMQDEKSIEQQKMEIEEYAKRNNIQIKKYYTDEAKSGTKNERDGFQAMITDACKDKDISCVLVWKTDRFARNTQDSLFYRNKLKKHGTKLISISQPIDDTTPEGKLMSTMLAGMDEYYSENLASNIRRAQKLKAKNYEFNGGIAPLGFDIVDKHYVINEKEAVIVKKIFDMYLNGHGLMEIAKQLNELGYKTKNGKEFGKNSIYGILGNEKYTGTYVFNKGYKHNKSAKRDDTIRIENALPQIISKSDFEKVNNLRHSHKQPGEFRAKRTYLLSGIIKCGQCGGNYIGGTSVKTKNGKKYETGYYKCTHRNKLENCNNTIVKQKELEEAIIKLLTERLLNSCEIEILAQKVSEEYKNIYKDSFNEIEQIKSQIKDTKKQITTLVDIIAKSPYSEALVIKLQELEATKKLLEDKLEFTQNIKNTPEISTDLIKKMLTEDSHQLRTGQAKEVIKKWVKKIEVYKDEILVDLAFEDNSGFCLVARVRTLTQTRIDLDIIRTR